MRPKVKICGLQKPVDAQYVNDAGADYAGFVFYGKSKRNVSCQKAKKIMEKIRPDIKKVAVTVSPDAAQIQILQQMKFDIIQMHGTLSAEALSAVELPVWYAINLSDPKEFAEKTKDFLDLPEKLQQKLQHLWWMEQITEADRRLTGKRRRRFTRQRGFLPGENSF